MTKPMILVADDDSSVRTFIRAILMREGFEPLEAVDGVDALEQLERHRAPIDLLVTDVRMPRMDGVLLARSVAELYPQMPVLYISGFPFDEEANPTRPCGFVLKPFTPRKLLDAIEKCLETQGKA
jgi:two-component system, cell cycle sensor histidine kinase and response regulator CckA